MLLLENSRASFTAELFTRVMTSTTMNRPKLLVSLKTYQKKWQIKPVSIRTHLQKIWRTLAKQKIRLPAQTEMTVVFLNDAQMRHYNRKYRKKDATTDVLSFSVNEKLVDQKHYLGDMLISVPQARRQAAAGKHELQEEVEILLLHGALHLLGYDHETDTGQMNRLESRIRKKLE